MIRCWPCIVVTMLWGLPAVATSASAQAGLESKFGDALGNLDVEATRRALQGGADPNERWAGRGMSALGRTGMSQMLGRQGKITVEEERQIIAVLDVLFEGGGQLRSSDSTILHPPAIAGA